MAYTGVDLVLFCFVYQLSKGFRLLGTACVVFYSILRQPYSHVGLNDK